MLCYYYFLLAEMGESKRIYGATSAFLALVGQKTDAKECKP
jgi:hypothetical protein